MVNMRVQNVVQARQVEEYRSLIETMVLPELSRTTQSIDLSVKSYILILWYQSDQRRNKPIHRARGTQARSDSCKKLAIEMSQNNIRHNEATCR